MAAMLDPEVEAAILALATEKMQESGLMEWPEIKRADQKKTIGLWVRNEEHWKQRGTTHVEFQSKRITVTSETGADAGYSYA